mgnify:CR=1 FL=1
MSDCLLMVPAKGVSRGLPAKNLHQLAGKPLVLWSLQQALAADIGPVVVVTDSPDITSLADAWGVTVYQEPAEIAGDFVSMESVMAWFLGQCRERSGRVPDWLMVLQPTSPLRLSGMIRESWAVAKSGAFDSVFSAVPSAHCSWRYHGTDLLAEWPQDLNAKKRQRMLRQQAGRQVTENGAIYAARVQSFLEEETRFCGRLYAYEMPLWTSWEIDGPEELAIVELIMRARLQLGSDGVRT